MIFYRMYVTNAEQMKRVTELTANNKILTKENERLGNSYHNMELLREQKRTVETRLRQMDELRSKYNTLEMENTLLRKEKAQWYWKFVIGLFYRL